MEDGKTFVVRKSTAYPKTCEECYGFLTIDEENHIMYQGRQLNSLITCRDAYWKLAGDWKPDYTNLYQHKYVITMVEDEISFEIYTSYHGILAFPTKEMRDTFYTNFKDLIEACKELI